MSAGDGHVTIEVTEEQAEALGELGALLDGPSLLSGPSAVPRVHAVEALVEAAIREAADGGWGLVVRRIRRWAPTRAPFGWFRRPDPHPDDACCEKCAGPLLQADVQYWACEECDPEWFERLSAPPDPAPPADPQR